MHELILKLYLPKSPKVLKTVLILTVVFAIIESISVFFAKHTAYFDIFLPETKRYIFTGALYSFILGLFIVRNFILKFETIGSIFFEYDGFYLKDNSTHLAEKFVYSNSSFHFESMENRGWNMHERKSYNNGFNKLSISLNGRSLEYFFFINTERRKRDIEGYLLFLKETDKAEIKIT